MDESINLGTCCSCGGTDGVRNIMTLHKKAPEPGKGWGCVVCSLPSDGAVAVLCDECLETEQPIRFAVKGYPASGERVPIEELSGVHEHNKTKHETYEAAVPC